MCRLLNEITSNADHKKRFRKAHGFIKASELLLQLVTSYEMKFNINPDYTSQNGSQIGNNKININSYLDYKGRKEKNQSLQ